MSGPASDIHQALERLVEAHGSDETRMAAFVEALRRELVLPLPASVLDREVVLEDLQYDGLVRRGLVARVSAGGRPWEISLVDVQLDPRSPGARMLEAYRVWMGARPAPLDEAPAPVAEALPAEPQPPLELDRAGGPLHMVVLCTREQSARCRDVASGLPVTLRTGRAPSLVPGEVLELQPRRSWVHGQQRHVSGEIRARHVDPGMLALRPLRLWDRGPWDPGEAYWGEPGSPIDPAYVPILQAGPRPSYEMEQVLPAVGAAGEPGQDPILKAIQVRKDGDGREARNLLMELLAEDLRCLDAHAHLGAFAFEEDPAMALRHYEVGVRVGGLSLPPGFNGVLPWRHLDNRPYLRCLEGFGLCLWRMSRFNEAITTFERLLWLNPGDHQGIRFLLESVRRHLPWKAPR